MDSLSSIGTYLSRELGALQREERIPSMSAAVARGGQTIWTEAVGLADANTETLATPDMQYRIGSISKTFTAAVVVMLADEARLDLDDRVHGYLPASPLGSATLRGLLSHTGGVQREPMTPMWQTFQGPDDRELLASLPISRLVSPSGQRWHYSNLGYALLGQIVRHVTGLGCEEMIHERLLTPLGMSRTTWQPGEPAARGYRVDPYQDIVHLEPDMELGALGVAGRLWSTTGDLLTWAHALMGDRPEVLPMPVVDAMHRLHVMTDADRWEQGWGLGLVLNRRDAGIFAGHTGAMPGFSSALAMHRDSRVAAVVLTNSSNGTGVSELAMGVAEHVVDAAGPAEQTWWRPGKPCPDELDGVLGRWWSESEETVFAWRDGQLHAHLAGAPATKSSVFQREDRDQYRVSEGRELGEMLHVLRNEHGRVRALEWATYRYKREPG